MGKSKNTFKRTLYLKLEIDIRHPYWEDYAKTPGRTIFQDWVDSARVDIEGTSLSFFNESDESLEELNEN